MPRAKRHRETQPRTKVADLGRPAALDILLRDMDELLARLATESSSHGDEFEIQSLPYITLRAARELVDRWLETTVAGGAALKPEGAGERIEDAWRRAMIEAQGRPPRVSAVAGENRSDLAALAQEMATYRERLAELLRGHDGQYVLIKGTEIVGVFPDRFAAVREGYQRFGIAPFLVRQITASEPVVYLPNVAP